MVISFLSAAQDQISNLTPEQKAKVEERARQIITANRCNEIVIAKHNLSIVSKNISPADLEIKKEKWKLYQDELKNLKCNEFKKTLMLDLGFVPEMKVVIIIDDLTLTERVLLYHRVVALTLLCEKCANNDGMRSNDCTSDCVEKLIALQTLKEKGDAFKMNLKK
jgi:hypothetical protein